jgi:glycosyltransferase involved in cell wall biosynthesis
LIATYNPDVVHVHFGYSGLAVPRTTVPIVTSYYGDDLNGTWKSGGGITAKSRLGILVSQWISVRSRRCIVVSVGMRDRLWRRAVREKTIVVRDAVDTALFRPLSRSEARRRRGVPEDAILILFPHEASEPTKRLWLAEAAVAALRSRCPRARLWVVNDVLPDEMPWVYAAADAMIITSALEGGPSSAKEALACGLPVVSVLVGDVELFGEAGGHMLMSQADPGSLAGALEQALSAGDPTRRNRLPEPLTLPAAAATIEGVYLESVA